MKAKLLFTTLAVFFVVVFTTSAQTPACGGTFTDPLGPNTNYAGDTDYTVTINPSVPGEKVTVTFTLFDTEIGWDALYVFNGNSINAPQIASTNAASNVPGGLAGGYWGTAIPGPFTSTSPDGSLTFRFRSDPDVNRAGWIANVTCALPPTCPKPTNLVFSNITATSTVASWTETGTATGWQLLVLPCASPVPTAGSTGWITATTNPMPITGLLSSTCYTVFVRAVCSETDSSDWSVGASFSTPIAPPACGGQFVDNGGASGNYANNSDNTYIICPDNPGDKVTVTFTSFNSEENWDALYVFDGNSIASPQIPSVNPASNVPGNLAGGFWGTGIPGPFTASGASGCLTFRFRSDATANRAGWTADVTCAPPPTCPKPTALIASNITAISAMLSWTENSTATQWECYLATSSSPIPTASSSGVIISANPSLFTGLSPDTCYTFYVRAICSGTDNSVWSVGSNFCTSMAPPACGGLFLDNGGAAANYANNSDNTYTICPSNAGEIVTVIFSSFDTEATWDALYVYDGSSLSAPQIASTNPAGNVPGGISGGYWGTTIPGPFTSTSPDGCLTFRFRSDTTVDRAGWVANVMCAPDADKILLAAFIDENNNGIKDTNENFFTGGSFIYQKNNDGINIEGYSPSGRYAIYDTENTYDFSYQVQSELATYFSAGTTAYSDVGAIAGGGTQVFYFPITITQAYTDVTVTIVPLSVPRPTLNYANRIVYRNQGIAPASGTLTFAKPPQATISNVSQNGVTNNVSGFSYTFTNLLPNETRTIDVTMTVAAIPTVNLNDLMTDTATLSGVANDLNIVNNTSTNSQIVVNSYDPNNKMESHGNKIPFNQFAEGDYFHYTIRFQNNGTASAIDLRIEDFLNAMIDEESVRMESASHNYVMNRIGNHLTWSFKNIYLPSSSINAAGSTGFVEFKVKLKPGFQEGDIVPNNASIYFDTNPAVTTNTFNVKFTQALGTTTFDNESLVIYPNPAKTTIQINMTGSTERISKVVLYDLLGKTVKTVDTTAVDSLALDVSNLARGVYLMEITSDSNSKLTKKMIIE